MLLLENYSSEDHLTFKPLFFRIQIEEDKEKLQKLLDNKPQIVIHDQISTQLDDLVKSKNPEIKKPGRKKLDELKIQHLGNINEQEYGVWIYYPWSNKLVHALDEEEFIEVRTNRNRYKITREEQQLLSTKKIGVVGLSVGQSIALTLAMERTCGEIRLADFDTAELSNLNRLRTGIQNLGLNKTIIAAREIAEIDPFIKVKLFNDGLHKGNMDAFFTEGGLLDLFVEVCDGLDIKIESRFKARELQVPVIMDTNDRGMLDVERFDLEPDRPILHGLADGLDPENIKGLTNEEKIPYVLRMIGAESISTRLKASMLEVEQSINTWPQLASSVVLGGALTTDVSRRVLLDQYHESGRYYIDLEEIVGDRKVKSDTSALSNNPYAEISPEQIRNSIDGYFRDIKAGDFELQQTQLDELINAAIAAPSAGNNQPWKWSYKNGILFLFHDKQKSWSWGDYYEMGSHMGLGTAIENVSEQAKALNLNAEVKLFPLAGDATLIAAIIFSPGQQLANKDRIDRAKHIFTRYTNRKVGKKQNLHPSFYVNLKAIASEIDDVNIHYIEDEQQLGELADIIAECDKVRLLDQLGHEEFFHEIRWTKEEAESTKDGIEIRAVDVTPSEIAGFKVARDWNAIQLISDWDKGNAFKKMSLTGVKAASGMLIFTIKDFTHKNLVEVGRSVQKSWLYATEEGVSVHPMLSPAFFFNRMIHGQGVDLSSNNMIKLEKLRERFLKLFPQILNQQETEVFMMKVCLADDIGVRSLRRDKEAIFVNY
jgi:hypothetical protein